MSKKDKEIYYELGFSSHQGTEKEVNEDNYCAVHREDEKSGSKALIAVSDGVGGFSLGEIASKITINNMEKFFKLGEFDQMFNEAEYLDPSRVIQELYTRINHMIRSLMEKENRQVGCTLVSGFFHNKDIYIANVGNSRAYIIRNGQIKQLTEEKSEVLLNVDISRVTANENLKEAKNPAYVNSLGSDIALTAHIKHFDGRDGDIILFCSDGLYTQLSDTDILDTAAQSPTMQKFANNLIDKANNAGGRDNVTVVAIRVNASKGIFSQGRPGKSSFMHALSLMVGALILALMVVAGAYFLMKNMSPTPKKPPDVGFKNGTGPINQNILNSLTLELELPIKSLKINGQDQPVTEKYQTFAFREDTNELIIMPNLAGLRPQLYTMTLMGAHRDLQVIQSKKNKVILKGDLIVVQLTFGSRLDVITRDDKSGSKILLTIDNLGTPYTIDMETVENIYVLIKPDEAARAAAATPLQPTPTPMDSPLVEETPTPTPKPTPEGL